MKKLRKGIALALAAALALSITACGGTGGSGGNGSRCSGAWSGSGGSVRRDFRNACGNHTSGSAGDPGGGKYASGGGPAGAGLYAWSRDARRPGWKQQSGRK